jgi:hypothetical protein
VRVCVRVCVCGFLHVCVCVCVCAQLTAISTAKPPYRASSSSVAGCKSDKDDTTVTSRPTRITDSQHALLCFFFHVVLPHWGSGTRKLRKLSSTYILCVCVCVCCN